MADVSALSPPTPGKVIADTLVRAAKTFVTTAIGVLSTNVLNWTNLSTLKAAGIAGIGAAATILLNLLLSWANSE
jgi:hypothetical protein